MVLFKYNVHGKGLIFMLLRTSWVGLLIGKIIYKMEMKVELKNTTE